MLATTAFRTPSKVALVASALLLSTAAAAPAFAALPSNYGQWSSPVQASAFAPFTGTIDFENTLVPDATYSTSFDIDELGNAVELLNSRHEWLGSETPFGAVFGASGPSSSTIYRTGLITGAAAAVTTITFATPVPADSLGIAVGDLDVDWAEIEATGADGAPLSGTELVGSATDTEFNFCMETTSIPTECSHSSPNPTSTPSRTTNATSIMFNANPGDDVGVTGWILPSVAVKTVTITHTSTPGGSSSSRIWLAGVPTVAPPAPPALAETGTSSSLSLALAAILGGLGIAGLMINRRVAARA